MVNILSTYKSGSYILCKYLISKLENVSVERYDDSFRFSNINDEKVYLFFINEGDYKFGSMAQFSEKILNMDRKTIILTRNNIVNKTKKFLESLGDTRYQYNTKFIYNEFNDVDADMFNECKFQFIIQNTILDNVSKKYNIPIFYYDNFLKNKINIDEILGYIGIKNN